MSCYEKGDKVIYFTKYSEGRAVFVKHDDEGLPKRDALLAIAIGVKPNRMTHIFRWPLNQLRPLQ